MPDKLSDILFLSLLICVYHNERLAWKDTQNLKAKTGLSTFHPFSINHQQVFCTDTAHESNNRGKLIR